MVIDMGFADTGFIHKTIYRTCYLFTVFVTLFTLISNSGSDGDWSDWIPNTAMILCILLYSFSYALSFLVFEAKAIKNSRLGDASKRIIHVLFLYLMMWVCFFLIPGNISAIKAFIIATFIFAVIYAATTVIHNAIKRAIEKL